MRPAPPPMVVGPGEGVAMAVGVPVGAASDAVGVKDGVSSGLGDGGNSVSVGLGIGLAVSAAAGVVVTALVELGVAGVCVGSSTERGATPTVQARLAAASAANNALTRRVAVMAGCSRRRPAVSA